MNQLIQNATRLLVLCAIVGGGACAKNEPKPRRTEPWLAHPPASAAASAGSDAALPATRYTVTEQSVIRFEVPSKRSALRGSLTRVSGELSVVLNELSRSRGQVRVDLSSLSFEGADADHAAARARAALEVSDAGSTPSATFDLSELSDVSPGQLEAAAESDAGAPFTRRARLTAVGNLLLHGFRVVRRAPLEVEFGFLGDRAVPSTLLIRSRAPFVVSLETHAIRAFRPESARKPKTGGASPVDEVRVSIELYGRKVE